MNFFYPQVWLLLRVAMFDNVHFRATPWGGYLTRVSSEYVQPRKVRPLGLVAATEQPEPCHPEELPFPQLL